MGLNGDLEKVPLETDERGAVRVGGTRVTLDSIIAAFEEGATAEGIVERFDTLDLADVYAGLAYYLRHREEVEAYLESRAKEAEALREKVESRFPTNELRERLLRRRRAGRR